jgi:hypothetical protein
MRQAWWVCVAAVILIFGAAVPTVAETIITTSGSVLQGQIEFGIPAVISVTTSTGDVFTVQRSNLKAIRFPTGKNEPTTVETFDGNIMLGTIGGVPEVLGVRSPSGDIQSVNLTSIKEIRFELPVVAPVQPGTTTAVPTPTTAAALLAAQVKDVYNAGRWGFTLALDSGFQVGVSSLNGFSYPKMTFGINGLGLGAVWRLYFGPSPKDIEDKALSLAQDSPGMTLDELVAATKSRMGGILLYLNLGTSMLWRPQIGVGAMVRISSGFYFDAGVSYDMFWTIWPSVGFVVFF